MNGLKFGFQTSLYPVSDLIHSGVLAEKCGFDYLWMPDHLVDVSYPGDRADPWTVLSATGIQTNHLRLGPAVTDGQRIHPAKTASIVATMDELTSGRAVLGIGAGENMNLAPYGIPFGSPDERAERLNEAIQVIKALWVSEREKRANFNGRYYRLINAIIDQKPIQKPGPPIYVGAIGAPRLLEIAGKIGDGWFPWLNSIETFAKRLALVKDALERAGRRNDPFDIVHLMHVAITNRKDEQKKQWMS